MGPIKIFTSFQGYSTLLSNTSLVINTENRDITKTQGINKLWVHARLNAYIQCLLIFKSKNILYLKSLFDKTMTRLIGPQ